MYWNEIYLSGDEWQIARLIPFLKNLDRDYLHNLRSANAHEGTVEFHWYHECKRHIASDGINIPDGDYWTVSNIFSNEVEWRDVKQNPSILDGIINE
jgi:hypothetical protein